MGHWARAGHLSWLVPCTPHSISPGALSSQEPPRSLYPEAEELPGNWWGQPKGSSGLDVQPGGTRLPLFLCLFYPVSSKLWAPG